MGPSREQWLDEVERSGLLPAPKPKRRRRRRSTRQGGIIGALLTAAVLAGLIVASGILPGPENPGNALPRGGSPAPTAVPLPVETEPDSSSPAPAPNDATASELLESIPVKGRAPRTGYDREGMFGAAWIDVDANGCDTRNDILNRDLSDKTMAGSCKVLSGTLNDPFTGAQILFERGYQSSMLVQIDHVVALSNAWQTGAQQITPDARLAFANDPLNLLAVDGASNQQKSDGDAATWLPPQKSFRCAYVARQVAVKAKYELWVTPPEHEAIARILATCPEQPAMTG